MYCPGGNANDPISRVLAYSDGISSWTSLKPQHSNPNPHPLPYQLCCIDFLTNRTPLIIPHRLSVFLESLMPLNNWCSLMHSIRFCGIFSKFKTQFLLHIVLLNCPHVQIAFLKFTSCSRVYSNCCCSCSFAPEIIKIGLSCHNMYSNNIVNFQESYTNFKCLYKKLIEGITYIKPSVYCIQCWTNLIH